MMFIPQASGASLSKTNRKTFCSEDCYETHRALHAERWNEAARRYGAVCAYCDFAPIPRRWHYLTLDHFQPISRGGDRTGRNVVLACRPCNQDKADLTPEEFLADQPERLKRLQGMVLQCELVE
jgi:5-methylcytosine-specific restriction endonuclease McrA